MPKGVSSMKTACRPACVQLRCHALLDVLPHGGLVVGWGSEVLEGAQRCAGV